MHFPESGHPVPLPGYFQNIVAGAVTEYFPEDACLFAASLAYLPNDDRALLPIGVVYVQINGTESVEGLYLIETIPPSMISKESVDAVVAVLSAQSSDRRAEIRAAMARGEPQIAVGLPKDVEVG